MDVREIEDLRRQMRALVRSCLEELAGEIANVAIIKPPCLTLDHFRPRIFTFAPGITWPRIDGSSGKPEWYFVNMPDNSRYSLSSRDNQSYLALRICELCGFLPSRVMGAVRSIKAARAWLRKRADGSIRHGTEIMKQHQRYIAEIEAEAVVRSLK